jgi:hypothetical protein
VSLAIVHLLGILDPFEFGQMLGPDEARSDDEGAEVVPLPTFVHADVPVIGQIIARHVS